MKKAVRVAVTGAAGNIGYALLFRIASGDMLGYDQPVILQLLEIPSAMDAVQGVMMELNDAAFPLVHGVFATDKAAVAFKDVEYALLVGSRPRGPGMERKDLLEANGMIFVGQGKALNDHASRDVKVLIVGNPANTNALIAMTNAPDLRPDQFSAMTRLDHNRAISQIATKTNSLVKHIDHVIIWGNHSATQVPDLSIAMVKGRKVLDFVDEEWMEEYFMPTVQQRGAAIIKARGSSSAASAASAAVDQMHDWAFGTEGDEWVSMAIQSRGDYGISDKIIYSFPVRILDNEIEVVQDIESSDFIKEKMKISEKELLAEREMVKHLL